MIATVNPIYDITDKLTFRGQFGTDYTNTKIVNKTGVQWVSPEVEGGNYYTQQRISVIEVFRGMLTYNNTFKDEMLVVSAMGGAEYKSDRDDYLNVSLNGFQYPDWFHLNNQNSNNWPDYNNRHRVYGNNYAKSTYNSLFGRITATWNDTYTLEVDARNDWSSTLPPENNSYFYPGIAATWFFSKQIFIPELKYGKLRMSFAEVGRDAPNRYYAYNAMTGGKVRGFSDVTTASVPSSLFGGVLKPERKREFEIGSELRFFKADRIRVDFSYYNNNVYDQIMGVDLTGSTGASEIRLNAGKVKN